MDARRALLLGRAFRRCDVRFFGSGERKTVLSATVDAVSGLTGCDSRTGTGSLDDGHCSHTLKWR